MQFDAAAQSLAALKAAAYRLIGTATCQVEQQGARYLCHLRQKDMRRGTQADEGDLRAQFLDLVTDENLREQLAVKTEPVRNLILSLAFGSLASDPAHKS